MKRTLLVLTMGGFTDGFDLLIIAGVLGEVIKTFRLTGFETGLLVSSSFMGSIVGAVLLGYLCDVMGRRKGYLISVILFVMGALISASATNYEVLILGRSLVGLGIGGEIPSSVTLLEEVSKKWVGLSFTAWAMGALSATAIPLFLSPWRLVLLLGGVPPLLVLIFHRWVSESEVWLGSSKVRIRSGTLETFVMGIGQFILTLVLASFAVYVPGYSFITQMTNWTFFAIGACLTFPLTSKKPVLSMSYFLTSVLLLMYTLTGWLEAIATLWLVSGIAFSSSFRYMGELRNARDRGTFNGILFFMGRLGGAIGTFAYPLIRHELNGTLLLIALGILMQSFAIPFLAEGGIERVE